MGPPSWGWGRRGNRGGSANLPVRCRDVALRRRRDRAEFVGCRRGRLYVAKRRPYAVDWNIRFGWASASLLVRREATSLHGWIDIFDSGGGRRIRRYGVGTSLCDVEGTGRNSVGWTNSPVRREATSLRGWNRICQWGEQRNSGTGMGKARPRGGSRLSMDESKNPNY